MKVHLLALIVGLAAIASADVRDILNNPQHSIYKSAGQPFTKQQYQPQSIQNPSKQFWWTETEQSPFTRSVNHNTQQIDNGCGSDCLSQNTLHNTPQQSQTYSQQDLPTSQQQLHTNRQDHYSQNPFMQRAFASQQQPQYQSQQQLSNIYARMASLSGTPNEVNSLMTDTTVSSFNQYRPVAKVPCYGASQVCAPKNACHNGFISESDLGLVQSQANNCDSRFEACCNIQPTERHYDQPIACSSPNSACVSPKHCFNGYIEQSAEEKAIQSPNGFCADSEVCCQFSQGKSANLVDNDFAAAAQSTSEVLTKEGYVVNVPSNQYLPSKPEPEYNPDASNRDDSRVKPTTAGPACTNGATNYPDCCTNGGTGPYCCTNGGSGPYCCTNGVTNNQYCCTNGAQNPQCTVIRDEPVPQPQPTSQQPRPTPPPQQPRPQPTPQQPGPNPPPQQPQPRPTPPPSRPYPPPTPRPQPSVNIRDDALIFTPQACAAAMNCTLPEFCDANGRISKEQQDVNNPMRVPMTDCMIRETQQQGKCCIDPDYTDPWPTGRTGQYVPEELNAVFDDGSYKPDRQTQRKRQTQSRGAQIALNSDQVVTRVAPPAKRNIARRQNSAQDNNQIVNQNINFPAAELTQIAAVHEAKCGMRNLGTQPRGKAPLGTGFGEFTWVAMVILESKKALLCGGAIIHKNLVVTSANCVHGHRHNDVLIKAGEWRLGSEEEPKPFQIVRVQRILFHPQYQPKTLQHDIALLYLENDIKYDDTHIQPICLDESETEPTTTDECVTTGWGKEVLKVHLGNALMQHVKVSVLPQADCQARLQSSNLGQSSSVICGVTQYDACQVDNGSALACATTTGQYVLKGVYSTETDCENPNQIVAFTRTDLQWIREVIRNPAHAARS